ncbi:Cox family DNA-binding protein [Xenorhabdus stockiae]|uniref:Cox family DNA-binding protein n=1 Tax=Xenorhabdus TaxID=626 RepID=UPI002359F652|nr:Cox family DNA-binding protein [Xenorhabdus griffiniae]MDC9603951.1 Cox family DNA-binding protein [Xenorhabdus griffiniae]
MLEKNPDGYMQVYYPVDAVPYQKFADLIGKTHGAVKGMVDKGKLPTVFWQNPDVKEIGGIPAKVRGENWVYIPEFNRGMRDAFLNRPKEQRDAWLLWVGL